MNEEQHPIFNNNSYISIGIVVLVIGATLWIKGGQSDAINANKETAGELSHYKELQAKNFDILSSKIDVLSVSVTTATKDRFSAHDHRVFLKRLQELNPTIKVPEEPDESGLRP